MAKQFSVLVERVNEGPHESADVSVSATSVKVDEDGTLTLKTEQGTQFFGTTTWGRVTIERVPGR